MSLGSILSATDISASGLSAERLRMEVVANNVANAYSTQTPEGGPYRRQEVVFESRLNEELDIASPGGVSVLVGDGRAGVGPARA